MVKINKSYLYFSSYIVCIFPIITLIFSVIYTNTPYLTGILSELGQSLNDFPLSELEFKNNCSEDKYSSILYEVPESVEGCSCVNVTKYSYKQSNKKLVFKGKCKKNNTLNGCISVKNYPPLYLKKWYSNEFCSKKYDSNFGYKEFFKNSVRKDEDCKNGYKKCGKLDESGNYLCLPEKEICPINDIEIYNEAKNISNLSDFKELSEGDKYIYYTNNSTEKALITKLKVAEGKLCLTKGYYYTEYPQFILDDHFDLYGCRYKINGKIYDDSVIHLDNITKYQFYNQNNFSLFSRYNYSTEYPYFSLNAEMFLYAKRYIGFDKQCMKDNNIDIDNKMFEIDYINKINNNLLKNRKQHRILIWVSIAAIDFYLMTCILINIDEDNTFLNFYIWCIITIPFYFSMNIIAIIGLAAMSQIKKYPLCNDNITNSKIKLFNNKTRNIFFNTLTLVIIINGQLLLTVVLFLFKRRKILRKQNNINESHILNSVNNISQDLPLVTQSSESSQNEKEDNN